jgi:FkbM family methyltransferase
MFISYAQNFEDVMLWRALKHVENGFYIDIGAQDPISDSVSKAFYDHGWRGVHVEPATTYAERLRAERDGETVIEGVVGPSTTGAVFYQIEGTGLSTMSAEIAEQHRDNDFEVEVKGVNSITLDDLLETYKDREIHWLKIDTEGSEPIVIASWRNSKVRPWIIVVESVDPITHDLNSAAWDRLVEDLGYVSAYFDGLNRFFVSKKHEGLLKYFDTPPNLFDNFAFSGLASSCFCSVVSANLNAERQNLAQVSQSLESLTAAHQGLERSAEVERGRLAAALEGLVTERGRLLDSENRLRQTEDRLKESENRLRQTEDRLKESESQLRQTEDRLKESESRLRQSEDRLKEGESDRARLLEQMDAQAEWWKQRINDLHRSSSWRMTAPLRVGARALRFALRPVYRALSITTRQAAATLGRCRLVYRRAAILVARRLFGMFGSPAYRVGAPTLPLLQLPTGVDDPLVIESPTLSPSLLLSRSVLSYDDKDRTLAVLMAGIGRWKIGRRLDA